MYFSVAGLSVDQLLATPAARLIEYVFFVISGIVLVSGIINYLVHKRRIARSEIHIGEYKAEYERED